MACTSNQDIETVYDPCSPLMIAVDPELDAVAAASVEAATQIWGRVLPTRMSVGAGSQAAEVLPIRFESGDSFYRAVYWDTVGMISISRDRLDPKDYALAIAHEMGHAFGLLHVSEGERRSIMNVGNLEVTPTADDVAEVHALWATCSDPPVGD